MFNINSGTYATLHWDESYSKENENVSLHCLSNYVKTNVSRYNRALNSHGVKVSQLESMSEEAIA